MRPDELIRPPYVNHYPFLQVEQSHKLTPRSAVVEVMSQSEELVLRVANHADSEALFHVQRASALEAYKDIFPADRYPFPDEEERLRWTQLVSSDDLTVFIAEKHRRPVGVAVAGEAHLQRLFVLPKEWGSGAGSRLHDGVIEVLRSEGVEIARLWVLEENIRARNFYFRKGWLPDGRTTRSAFPPYPSVLGYSLSLLGESASRK